MSGDHGHMRTMRLLPFTAAVDEGSLDGSEPRSLTPNLPHRPCLTYLPTYDWGSACASTILEPSVPVKISRPVVS
jgi:hypothetical protein